MPNALPLVYEFDENLKHINNYALMDLDAHKIKKENRNLSYNNIDMSKYQTADGRDLVRDTDRYRL